MLPPACTVSAIIIVRPLNPDRKPDRVGISINHNFQKSRNILELWLDIAYPRPTSWNEKWDMSGGKLDVGGDASLDSTEDEQHAVDHYQINQRGGNEQLVECEAAGRDNPCHACQVHDSNN